MDPQRAYLCMSVCVSKVKGTQETPPEPCGDSDLVYWLRERAGYLRVNRCLSADKLICLVSDTCSLCGRSWSSCQKPHWGERAGAHLVPVGSIFVLVTAAEESRKWV